MGSPSSAPPPVFGKRVEHRQKFFPELLYVCCTQSFQFVLVKKISRGGAGLGRVGWCRFGAGHTEKSHFRGPENFFLKPTEATVAQVTFQDARNFFPLSWCRFGVGKPSRAQLGTPIEVHEKESKSTRRKEFFPELAYVWRMSDRPIFAGEGFSTSGEVPAWCEFGASPVKERNILVTLEIFFRRWSRLGAGKHSPEVTFRSALKFLLPGCYRFGISKRASSFRPTSRTAPKYSKSDRIWPFLNTLQHAEVK